DLEAGAAGPSLQDLNRFVVRIVDDDHLVLGVLELCERVQQALDDALLVVGGDVHRYERVVAELDVIDVAVAAAIDSLRSGAVGLDAVAVPRTRADERG